MFLILPANEHVYYHFRLMKGWCVCVEGGRSSQPGHCPGTAWVSQVPSSLWGELGNLSILFQTQPSAFERTTKLACVVAQSLCSAFCCCFKQQFIKHKIFLIYWLYCDLLASSYYVNTEIKEWLRLPSLAEDKHKHSYNTEKLQWLRSWECQRRPLRWHLGELVLQSGLRGQCLTSFVVLPFLWRGKQLPFIQLFWSLCLIFTHSLTRGLYTTVFCPEYWPHTNPLPCFGFCLSWERVSFCRPGWPGLCVDQAGLKLRAICHLCLSSAGTTDVHHHIWSLLCFESTSDSVSE